MEDLAVFILDLLGTAVFAVTGAVQGVRKKFDIFGVTVLACCVGVGGGMVRDIIIGAVPVAALQNECYLIICILVGIIAFRSAGYWIQKRNIIRFFDAVGLGVFTVLGAAKGHDYGLGMVGCVLCGVSTAIGGGIIRDVLTNRIPVVLQSDFYATAALLGGIVYYLLLPLNMSFFALFIIVAGLVTTIRILAIHFKLKLPSAGRKKDIVRK